MVRKFVVMSLILAGVSVPAMAAENFYIGVNPATKKCQVVNMKPDGKTLNWVHKKAYATENEATAAMKAAKKDCASY